MKKPQLGVEIELDAALKPVRTTLSLPLGKLVRRLRVKKDRRTRRLKEDDHE